MNTDTLIDLLTPVQVGIPDGDIVRWEAGVVIGRTREKNPRYSVRLPDGTLVSDVSEKSVRTTN